MYNSEEPKPLVYEALFIPSSFISLQCSIKFPLAYALFLSLPGECCKDQYSGEYAHCGTFLPKLGDFSKLFLINVS